MANIDRRPIYFRIKSLQPCNGTGDFSLLAKLGALLNFQGQTNVTIRVNFLRGLVSKDIFMSLDITPEGSDMYCAEELAAYDELYRYVSVLPEVFDHFVGDTPFVLNERD